MGGRYIEEDLFVNRSIIDPNLPEGEKIHDFLMSRATALAGKRIDFEKHPVTFVLSDIDEPNGFFAPAPNPKKKPERNRDATIRYIKNPLDTDVICVTKGLVDMVDSLDELDQVLAHELTHMIMRIWGVENNSKGEEAIADIHAVDLMYDAGGDPKEALTLQRKLSAYIEENRKKLSSKRRRKSYDDEEHGINWSEIFDVHLTRDNTLASLEASLTRLSHLIDDRKPTPLDKSIFDARYQDPVDAFLEANDYKSKKPLGQLKTLIDCIEKISGYESAEKYFQSRIKALSEEEMGRSPWRAQEAIEELTKAKDEGYKRYFVGPTINKHYQQKIANLAEGVIGRVERERRIKDNPDKPAAINAKDLRLYLQNKAYAHVTDHGYPEASDFNFLDAASIMYNYFYCLCTNNIPSLRRWGEDKDSEAARVQAQIFIDIDNVKQQIITAETADEFILGRDHLTELLKVDRDIRVMKCGEKSYEEDGKLDDLSVISAYGFSEDYNLKQIYYDDFNGGEVVPWQNLYEIAQEDEAAKEAVIEFLSEQGIKDYRLTHGLPYVEAGHECCFKIDECGKLSDNKIPNYQLEFATNREQILGAYAYIKAYFENETAYVGQTCQAAANISDIDFKEFLTHTDRFNSKSIAHKKYYDFISMFNALPDDKDDGYSSLPLVIALIPERYRHDHPMPGMEKTGESRNDWRLMLDEKLFDPKNPIFQAHFESDYKDQVLAQKETVRDVMFDTVFAILDTTIDTWLEAKPRYLELRKQSALISDAIYESDDKSFKEAKQKEREVLEKEIEFAREKEETTSSVIYHLIASVFDSRRFGESPWQLNRLRPEQAHKLALFAVHDEKGAVVKSFKNEGYEHFCDYLKILQEQTDQVMSGSYDWTEMMSIVANNHGYTPSRTNADFKAFTEESQGQRYSRDEKKYNWYLHIFDVMQYLETSTDLDINTLAIALQEIEQSERSSVGFEDYKVIEARYENYLKFIKESQLLSLAGNAINNEGNYQGLSFNDLIDTIDNLAAVRGQYADLLGETVKDPITQKEQKVFKSTHQRFFDIIDEKITHLIIAAEEQALRHASSLKKAEKLYRLYNPIRRGYSDTSSRTSYIEKLKKEEKRLEKISELSKASDFWPGDILDHVKAYVFAKETFLDDKELEDKLLNNILSKLESAASSRKKNQCLFILLDKNLRAAYPETRERLFCAYVEDVTSKIGKDDGSAKYQQRLEKYLEALESDQEKEWDIGKKHSPRYRDGGLLSNSIAPADKYVLLRQLSDSILSQEQASEILKTSCQAKLTSEDLVRSYLHGIGVDLLTEKMDRDPQTAKTFIKFLNSKGENDDCEQLSTHIAELAEKEKWHGKDNVIANTKPSNCKILYENFWSAPLEARSVIVARMLKSSINTKEEKQDQSRQGWERVFDVVMDNLIKPDDETTEAKYACDIMHSYIKSRSDYERELILSAMMVANRNIGEDAGNVGKALKLFLENMGPAEIKLGQAIASHPDTPESIRTELQGLKSSARVPARWTIYDWIKTENIPEKLWKNRYLGEILGAASYYTTVELGDDEVLRLLVPEAREKATKGFKVIGATVKDLQEKDETSELSYAELTASVQEMVTQASRMSHIETDHDIGEQQYKDAKDIYDGVSVHLKDRTYRFKAMDWTAKGQNWMTLKRAKGLTFNALPEDTPEQMAYKKEIAIGYIVFEIKNILSGKKFDHDKHGDQLCIDEETDEVGIFDTGAMAVNDPTTEEQRVLGHVLYDAMKNTIKDAMTSSSHPFASMGRVISEKIDELHGQGIDTQYLVEVKKGLLALGDFSRVLDEGDIPSFNDVFDMSTDLSRHVRQGLEEQMSIFEKAQFRAFSAMQSAKKQKVVVIERRELAKTPANVNNFSVAPEISGKASWLQKAFVKKGAGVKAHKPALGSSSTTENNDMSDLIQQSL